MGLWRRTKKIIIVAAIIGLILWLLPAIFQEFFSQPKSEIFACSFFIGGIVIGFLTYKISYDQWVYNSQHEEAMLIGGVWYKSIKLDNPHSWGLALKHISGSEKKILKEFEWICEELNGEN